MKLTGKVLEEFKGWLYNNDDYNRTLYIDVYKGETYLASYCYLGPDPNIVIENAITCEWLETKGISISLNRGIVNNTLSSLFTVWINGEMKLVGDKVSYEDKNEACSLAIIEANNMLSKDN